MRTRTRISYVLLWDEVFLDPKSHFPESSIVIALLISRVAPGNLYVEFRAKSLRAHFERKVPEYQSQLMWFRIMIFLSTIGSTLLAMFEHSSYVPILVRRSDAYSKPSHSEML